MGLNVVTKKLLNIVKILRLPKVKYSAETLINPPTNLMRQVSTVFLQIIWTKKGFDSLALSNFLSMILQCNVTIIFI